MSQIVENWSRVTGQVESWQPSGDQAPGLLKLRIRRVGVVPRAEGDAYPSLLQATEGEVLTVRLSTSAASTLRIAAGRDIELDVRRGRDPDLWFGRVSP